MGLSCGDEAFMRVRDSVLLHLAGLESDIERDGIRMIVIRREPTEPTARPISNLGDRMALLGCGVVGCAVAFVMLIGLSTIAGWLR